MSKAFTAASWNLLSSIFRSVLQLAQLVILTRFLSPQDYGLMAMVMVAISYAALFSDMGLSTAFIQRQHVTNEERSSLYWLSVAVGAGLMLMVMAASPLAAYALNEPKLSSLISLVSTNFLAIALSQQLRIDAEKSLNFRPVALIEIFTSTSGFFVAVLTAWLGWEVYALVASAMLSTWLTMLLYWLVLAQGWRPMWRLRWAEVRWFVRFGGGMVLNNLINHINSTVDVLLGGRLLGVAPLGLYSVPRNLILQIQSMVNPIFTRVGLPAIASAQHDHAHVRHIYLKMMNLTATLNAPIYVAIGAFSPELVELLFGENFQESAPLLRILAVWGLLRSFANPAGSLVFGLGRVRLGTWWNLGLLFVVPPALWFGSQYGAEGMTWAMAAVMAALFIPGWALLVLPTCGAGLWDYSRQVLMPTLCAILAGIVAWLAAGAFSLPWMRLGTGLVWGLAAYAAFSWLLNRECIDIVINTIKHRTLPTTHKV